MRNGLPPRLQVQARNVCTRLKVLGKHPNPKGIGGHAAEPCVVADDPRQGLFLQLVPLSFTEHEAVFPPKPGSRREQRAGGELAPFPGPSIAGSTQVWRRCSFEWDDFQRHLPGIPNCRDAFRAPQPRMDDGSGTEWGGDPGSLCAS